MYDCMKVTQHPDTRELKTEEVVASKSQETCPTARRLCTAYLHYTVLVALLPSRNDKRATVVVPELQKRICNYFIFKVNKEIKFSITPYCMQDDGARGCRIKNNVTYGRDFNARG